MNRSTTATLKRNTESKVSQIAQKEKELDQARKELAAAMDASRALIIDNIKGALALAAQEAHLTPYMCAQEARETVQDYLIETQAVPVHPSVCEALIEHFAFNPALITRGEFKGIPVGFIPGLPLLKFVGFINFDAPTLQEASLLLLTCSPRLVRP